MNIKNRYRITIYIILFLSSFVLAGIAFSIFHSNGSTSLEFFDTYILNISTGLLGASLVFFVVERIFKINESDLSDRVQELVSKYEEEISFLKSREVKDSEMLERLIKSAETIDVLGYNCDRFLKTFLGPLSESTAKARVLMIADNTTASNLIAENSPIPEFQIGVMKAVEQLKLVQKDRKPPIEVRAINWIPSCNMVIINRDDPMGYYKIGINTPSYNSSTEGRPYFVLKPLVDTSWTEFFRSQYEQLWAQATRLELDQVPSGGTFREKKSNSDIKVDRSRSDGTPM